jgi:cell division protein ZapA
MTTDGGTDKSKQPIRVNIFNQVYTVVTSGDPNDTLAVAHEVDELMSTIARRAGNLDSTRAAVLACLHLADRLRVIEKQLAALRESVDQKSRNITELLNKVIPQD